MLADELMREITGLRRVMRRRLREGLPGPALTGTRLELLHVVEAEPGIGVAAAARAMRLAGNTVSTLVNALVREGYLRRETDPTDRRAARLWLGEAATRRLSEWRRARGVLVAGGLEALPRADRQAIEKALPALRRLVAILTEEA